MANAQDRAFAALAIGQGLLAPEAVAALEPIMIQGDTLPQLLVQRAVLAPAQVSRLLRDLARTGFGCSDCGARFTYDSLARLDRLRCPGCGGDVVRAPGPPPSDAWPAVPGSSFGTAPGRHPRTSSLGAIDPSEDTTLPGQLHPNAPLGPGSKLGPYTLGEPLGKGSYGLVFLATRGGLERRFALKVMIDGEFADAETIARFQLEAAVASKIDHPGVIDVYDVGREGDRFYYAMEYCPGMTLKEVLRDRTRLEPHEAATLIRHVAETMVATHAKGVIHRDLKPSNIIVEESGGLPRVTDFGLARDHSLLRSMTQSGDVLGTPHYMAPEQFRGERDLDHRIDIYALGVIFYQCLTGERPYRATTPVELASQVCAGSPPDPRDVRPEIPPMLAAICLRAMACDADDRYPTADALVADLVRLQSGQKPLAAQDRRPAVLVGIGAALLALVLGAVVLGLQRRGERLDSPAPLPPAHGGDSAEARRLLAAVRASLDDTPSVSLEALRVDLDRAKMLAGGDLHLQRSVRSTRDQVDARLLLARARERARRRDATEALIEALSRAAKLARGDTALHTAITLETARLLVRRGQIGEARTAIDRIPEDGSRASLEARLLRGLAFERQGELEQASRAYSALGERDPKGAFGLTAEAAGHRLRDDHDDALTSADAALAVDGDCAQALIERGLALVSQGDVDAAESALSRVLERIPDDPRVLVGLGKLRLSEGKPATASRAFRAAVDLIEVDHDGATEALLGLALARQGKQEEAQRTLSAVLQRDPDRLDALLHRGALLLARGERDAAAKDWRRAYERNSMGAQLLLETWHDAETLRAFHSLVGDSPKGEEQEKIFVLGSVHEAVVRHYHTARLESLPGPVRDDVLDALVRAAKAAPLQDILYALKRGERMLPDSALLQLEKARILAGRDHIQAATKALARARELGGEEHAVSIQLLTAELHWREGDLAAALEGYEAVAASARSQASGLTARAQAHWLLGNREPALTSAQQALKVSPNDHVALTLAAMVHLAQGRPDVALKPMREAYERVGSLDSRLLAVRAALIVRFKRASSLDVLGQMRDMMSVEQHLTISEGSFCSQIAAALTLESEREDVQGWGQSTTSRVRNQRPDAPDVLLLAGYAKLLRGELKPATAYWRKARKKAPRLPFPRTYLERFERLGGAAADLAAFRKR